MLTLWSCSLALEYKYISHSVKNEMIIPVYFDILFSNENEVMVQSYLIIRKNPHAHNTFLNTIKY